MDAWELAKQIVEHTNKQGDIYISTEQLTKEIYEIICNHIADY